MPVMRQDVIMLNEAMQGLGQSFAQRRQQEAEASYRQQLLDREIERQKALQQHYTAEEQHYKNMEEGQSQGAVETYLQTDDGKGVIKFHGPQKGLDTLIQNAAAKGKTLTPMGEPPQKQPFAVIKTTTPIGDIEYHAQDADQLGNIAEQVKKQGGKSPSHTSSQYGPIAADKYATEIEDRADELEQQVQSGNMPGLDAQVRQSQVIKGLRDRAKSIRSGIGRAEPQNFMMITEKPGLPNQPPEITKSYKVPMGSHLPAAQGNDDLDNAVSATVGAQPTLMKNKAGQTVKVPSNQVERAKQLGYTPQ